MPIMSWAHSQYWAGTAGPAPVVTPDSRKQTVVSEKRSPSSDDRSEAPPAEVRVVTVPSA